MFTVYCKVLLTCHILLLIVSGTNDMHIDIALFHLLGYFFFVFKVCVWVFCLFVVVVVLGGEGGCWAREHWNEEGKWCITRCKYMDEAEFCWFDVNYCWAVLYLFSPCVCMFNDCEAGRFDCFAILNRAFFLVRITRYMYHCVNSRWWCVCAQQL